MRRFLPKSLSVLFLLTSACSYGAAQELKTVTECRSYREAWFTSENEDVHLLTVRELLWRGDQLMTCARDIDKEPLQQGMTCHDALKADIGEMTYTILSSAYYQEAYVRAGLFLASKNLVDSFVTDDEKGRQR
jgi:hypothetical protein